MIVFVIPELPHDGRLSSQAFGASPLGQKRERGASRKASAKASSEEKGGARGPLPPLAAGGPQSQGTELGTRSPGWGLSPLETQVRLSRKPRVKAAGWKNSRAMHHQGRMGDGRGDEVRLHGHQV